MLNFNKSKMVQTKVEMLKPKLVKIITTEAEAPQGLVEEAVEELCKNLCSKRPELQDQQDIITRRELLISKYQELF